MSILLNWEDTVSEVLSQLKDHWTGQLWI